jgi:hypothetical protein
MDNPSGTKNLTISPWEDVITISPCKELVMEFTFMEDESIFGEWTLNYIPPGGGRFTGKLAVTDKRLLFNARFDTSLSGIIEEAMFIKHGSEGYISIPKDRISKVEIVKKGFQKNVVVTLDTGAEHTFNYGVMKVDKIAEAIRG